MRVISLFGCLLFIVVICKGFDFTHNAYYGEHLFSSSGVVLSDDTTVLVDADGMMTISRKTVFKTDKKNNELLYCSVTHCSLTIPELVIKATIIRRENRLFTSIPIKTDIPIEKKTGNGWVTTQIPCADAREGDLIEVISTYSEHRQLPILFKAVLFCRQTALSHSVTITVPDTMLTEYRCRNGAHVKENVDNGKRAIIFSSTDSRIDSAEPYSPDPAEYLPNALVYIGATARDYITAVSSQIRSAIAKLEPQIDSSDINTKPGISVANIQKKLNGMVLKLSPDLVMTDILRYDIDIEKNGFSTISERSILFTAYCRKFGIQAEPVIIGTAGYGTKKGADGLDFIIPLAIVTMLEHDNRKLLSPDIQPPWSTVFDKRGLYYYNAAKNCWFQLPLQSEVHSANIGTAHGHFQKNGIVALSITEMNTGYCADKKNDTKPYNESEKRTLLPQGVRSDLTILLKPHPVDDYDVYFIPDLLHGSVQLFNDADRVGPVQSPISELRSEVTIIVPKNRSIETLPPAYEQMNEFCSVKQTVSITDSTITITREISFSRAIIPADKWREIRINVLRVMEPRYATLIVKNSPKRRKFLGIF